MWRADRRPPASESVLPTHKIILFILRCFDAGTAAICRNFFIYFFHVVAPFSPKGHVFFFVGVGRGGVLYPVTSEEIKGCLNFILCPISASSFHSFVLLFVSECLSQECLCTSSTLKNTIRPCGRLFRKTESEQYRFFLYF